MPWPLIGAAVAAGASLIGGAKANKNRRQEAQKDRDFQSSQAERQMGFQERMRNTQWQAGVTDMEAAGLNPALAYSQGGAASPMGASGSGSRANQEDAVAGAVSSAMQYKRLNAEIANIRAQTSATKATTSLTEARPTNVLRPGVEAAGGAMEDLFSGRTFGNRNMNIIKYEVVNSAKSVADAVNQTVEKIKRAFMEAPASIGRIFNRRRN